MIVKANSKLVIQTVECAPGLGKTRSALEYVCNNAIDEKFLILVKSKLLAEQIHKDIVQIDSNVSVIIIASDDNSTGSVGYRLAAESTNPTAKIIIACHQGFRKLTNNRANHYFNGYHLIIDEIPDSLFKIESNIAPSATFKSWLSQFNQSAPEYRNGMELIKLTKKANDTTGETLTEWQDKKESGTKASDFVRCAQDHDHFIYNETKNGKVGYSFITYDKIDETLTNFKSIHLLAANTQDLFPIVMCQLLNEVKFVTSNTIKPEKRWYEENLIFAGALLKQCSKSLLLADVIRSDENMVEVNKRKGNQSFNIKEHRESLYLLILETIKNIFEYGGVEPVIALHCNKGFEEQDILEADTVECIPHGLNKYNHHRFIISTYSANLSKSVESVMFNHLQEWLPNTEDLQQAEYLKQIAKNWRYHEPVAQAVARINLRNDRGEESFILFPDEACLEYWNKYYDCLPDGSGRSILASNDIAGHKEVGWPFPLHVRNWIDQNKSDNRTNNSGTGRKTDEEATRLAYAVWLELGQCSRTVLLQEMSLRFGDRVTSNGNSIVKPASTYGRWITSWNKGNIPDHS